MQLLTENDLQKTTADPQTGDEPLPDPQPIVDLWGGMDGLIWVLYAGWNRGRIGAEVLPLLCGPRREDEGTSQQHEAGLTPEQVARVVDYVSRYGSHIVAGDAIAMQHVLGVLRSIYAPSMVRSRDIWELGTTPEALERSDEFQKIIRQNVVLVCGPVGNPATELFLRKLGIQWLFPQDARVQPTISRRPGDDDPLRPEGSPPESLSRDVGIWFRCRNPFADEGHHGGKRLYAAMGAYAFGTQGAAAAACSAPCASEVSLTRGLPAVRKLGVDMCAWVEIRPGSTSRTLASLQDLHNSFQLVWPPAPDGRPWVTHSNPSSIIQTLQSLQEWLWGRSRLEKRIPQETFVTYPLGGLLVSGLLLSALTCTLLALLWGKLSPSVALPAAILEIGVLVPCTLGLAGLRLPVPGGEQEGGR